MQGNEAIARAIIDAGTDLVSCVPGFGGTQIFETCASLQQAEPVFSFHEEVAFASAFGAAICGKISMMLTKVHGLTKATNAITDSQYMWIEGTMLVLVFEDKTGRHSDNIMYAEPIIKGLQLPYLKAEAHNAISVLNHAWEKSSEIKNPVYVIFDAAIVDEEISVDADIYQPTKRDFIRNLPAHLQVPVFADYQHEVKEYRVAGKNPNSIPIPAIPVYPDDLPPVYAGYMQPYARLMDVFKNHRGQVVFGDTGISTLFAFPPYNCVDVCAHMGGSVAMATGAAKSGVQNVWAVTGDFSFIAAGHLGLIEAANQNLNIKILIFKNDKAQTTGGQNIDGSLLEKILTGFKDAVVEIRNPQDKTEVESALQKAANSKQLQIVIAHFSKHKK
jgi:TPP-dependent indolepyruvate ferredoxin oxidoreductase alpha subunit